MSIFAYKRSSSKGSISLILLTICLFIGLSAQVALLLTGQEMRQTIESLTGRQMRTLCYTAMDAVNGAILPEGSGELVNVVLEPSGKNVTLNYNSMYSDDRSFYNLLFQARGEDGSLFRMQRLEFFVPPLLLELSAEYPLIYRNNIEGTEYLIGAEIYTSNEGVKVPQVSFLDGIGINISKDEQLHKKGLSGRFYHIRNDKFDFFGHDTYYGSTVFTSSGSINIGEESKFPDKIVFITDRGNITIGSGVQMDNAIIIAKNTVVIEPGCRIKGVIYADRIRIVGKSDFMVADNIVAQFSAKSFIS